MAQANPQQPVLAGVDALIMRLRQEGVDEGRAAAGKMIAEAEARAREILAKAETTAKSRTDGASQEADNLKRAGEEALKVAMRDAVLELKEGLTTRFAKQIQGVVAKLSTDQAVLEKMILAVASRARDEAGVADAEQLEIVLPRSVLDVDELRRKPQDLRNGALSQLALGAAADLLRDGVSFQRSDDDAGGIRVVLKGDGLMVDLTDAAVAEVILRHLQPRFRALLEGVVS